MTAAKESRTIEALEDGAYLCDGVAGQNTRYATTERHWKERAAALRELADALRVLDVERLDWYHDSLKPLQRLLQPKEEAE